MSFHSNNCLKNPYISFSVTSTLNIILYNTYTLANIATTSPEEESDYDGDGIVQMKKLG